MKMADLSINNAWKIGTKIGFGIRIMLFISFLWSFIIFRNEVTAIMTLLLAFPVFKGVRMHLRNYYYMRLARKEGNRSIFKIGEKDMFDLKKEKN